MASYFTDRICEFPGRVLLTPVSGEPEKYDMTRAEGTVTTPGTPFNAATFNGIADEIIAATKTYYGTCSTSGSAQVKTISVSGGDFELKTGAVLAATMRVPNSYAGTIQLDVAGTGAKDLRMANNNSTKNQSITWAAAAVLLFIYDGTRWLLISGAKYPVEQVTGTNGSILSYGMCTGWYDTGSGSVRLSFAFSSGTNNIGQGTEIFNIPASYRPASSVDGTMIIYTASGTVAGGRCELDTSGAITQPLTSQGRTGFGTIEYYI